MSDPATPDQPFPPFEGLTEIANTYSPQFNPVPFSAIPLDIASTSGVRSEATLGEYNSANIRTISESFVYGIRAQRFTDYINRIGQDIEWWRAVPHITTQIPIGANSYVDSATGYALRNTNFNPAEEVQIYQYGQFLQLKGWVSVNGETTVFKPGVTEVVASSFRLQSSDFSATYSNGLDYILDSGNGQIIIPSNSTIPLKTILKASYLISMPCVDPYTGAGRTECPIDMGEGYVYHSGAGIMDQDGKTMLYALHSGLSNSRDLSALSLSRSSGGTAFVPITRPASPMTSGFESNTPQLSVPPIGPGIVELGNNSPRFSYYDRPDRAMLMLENMETNLILDSSFEVDPLGSLLSRWSAYNVSATTSNTYFMHGNQAALLDTTVTSNFQPGLVVQTQTLAPGSYLLYAYVRFPSSYNLSMIYPIYNSQVSFTVSNFPVMLYASSSLSDAPLQTTIVKLPGQESEWMRIQAVVTVPTGGNAVMNLGFFIQPGQQVWVDAVQLQSNAIYPTSYIPTTFQGLMRNADVLSAVNYLGNLAPFQSGISMRVRPNWSESDLTSADRRWLFKWGTDPQRIWLYYQAGFLVLSVGALDENGSPKTVDVTMPWNPQYEAVYKISALWDNTQGNYLSIDNQWIENTLTPIQWNPSNYSSTFYIGSDGTTNFDGWISDVVGWGVVTHPQEVLAIYYKDDEMIFNTATRIKAILSTPQFKAKWSKIGFFEEGDVEMIFPANYRISADSMGSLEDNTTTQAILVRHKFRVFGRDFRALNPPEWMTIENEIVARRVHLRLIQTSTENRL